MDASAASPHRCAPRHFVPPSCAKSDMGRILRRVVTAPSAPLALSAAIATITLASPPVPATLSGETRHVQGGSHPDRATDSARSGAESALFPTRHRALLVRPSPLRPRVPLRAARSPCHWRAGVAPGGG